MNILFRLLLTFNATSLLLIVFIVQKGYTIGYFIPVLQPYVCDMPNILSYTVYFLMPILLTGVSIFLSPYLGKDSFKSGDVVSIEHANNSFLPSYLGYFFVALSIGNWETLLVVYVVLFIFTFLSQALYFNPLFLIYRFEFYNIKTKAGACIFLISQKRYKLPPNVEISTAFRINDFTFIEKA